MPDLAVRLPRVAPRPSLPPGPYLVAGLGRAGQAATALLTDRAGGAAVRGWTELAMPGTAAAVERLRAAGGAADIGPWGAQADAEWACLVKSPGVPLDAAPVREARRRGAPILDEAELTWRLRPWPVIGVTGTNGKGTVCALVTALLRAAGVDAAVGGNTEGGEPLGALPARAACVVAELSSFQLEGCPALLPEVAVLTNLARDHLDRHGDMATYAAAKRRLFVRDEGVAPVSVTGADDPFGQALTAELRGRGGRVVTFGRATDADVRIEREAWTATAGRLSLRLPDGRRLDLESRLPGPHNGENVATAVAVSHVLGLRTELVRTVVAATDPPLGRIEAVDAGQPFVALVDYAHNLSGLAALLATGRGLLGPGGELRVVLSVTPLDPGKREAMGTLAADGSDHLVLSTGSTLGEAPGVAVAALARGAARAGAGGTVEVMADRREAIHRVAGAARRGDVVLLLGRGASPRFFNTPDWRGEPFDDRQVLREALTA